MPTFKELVAAKDAYSKAVEPLEKRFDKYKKLHEEKREQLAEPFLETLGKYLDERLVDKHGTVICKGDIITKVNRKYYVEERGIQAFLGQLFENPRLSCYLIKDGESLKKSNARHRNISASELKEFEIIKPQQNHE